MVNSRTKFSQEIVEVIKNAYEGYIRVYETEIPNSIRAVEATERGKSIYAHDGKGKVAAAYGKLTQEVLENE